jgi:hypothetical protein
MDGEEGAKIEVEAPVAVLKYRVKAQQRTVGVCVRSSRLRTAQDESACWQLTSYEFLDNEEFGNLDSLLVQLGPGCVYVTLDAAAKSGTPKGDLAKLINLLERRKCAVSAKRQRFTPQSSLLVALFLMSQVEHAPAVEFKVEPDHLRRSLERLLSNASVLPQFTSELDRPLATGCLAALLSLLGMDAEADGTCTMTLGRCALLCFIMPASLVPPCQWPELPPVCPSHLVWASIPNWTALPPMPSPCCQTQTFPISMEAYSIFSTSVKRRYDECELTVRLNSEEC